MQTAQCSDCNSDIIVDDDAYEGDLLDCPNCGAELEIISLHPLQLSVVRNENSDDRSKMDEDELRKNE